MTPFTWNRLGENTFNGSVTGRLFDIDGGWPTYCWENIKGKTKIDICNPVISSNTALRRCPNPDLCGIDNVNWPSIADIITAYSIDTYDSEPYTKDVSIVQSSFRCYK